MATYTKQLLSASTDGRFIKITTTGSPGDTIHTAHASSLDEIILSVVNDDTSDHTLYLQYGNNSDILPVTVPAGSGMIYAIPQESHCLLTNSLVLRAYADSANHLWVGGCVNRITS